MTTEKFANLAETILNGAVTSGATSLTVSTGTGALFPSTGNFRIICEEEIMLVTARATDAFTVSRHQEGTAAAAHADATAVVHVLTASGLDTGIADQMAAHNAANPHYNAYAGTTETIGSGGEIWVDSLVGRDQAAGSFDATSAGLRRDPFATIGTRAGASVQGAIPFGVKNGTGATAAGAYTVKVRAGARAGLAPTVAGPPPVFGSDGTNKPRTYTIDEQINPPHGVNIEVAGSPSDGTNTALNAGMRVVPSAIFPSATALIKIQKSTTLKGAVTVPTHTGGIGFDVSGNNAILDDCVAYRAQAQGVIAYGNGLDNGRITRGFYRECDQSNSGVAAIEFFDNTNADPSKMDAPNKFTVGPDVDFAGNLNGAIKFHSHNIAATPGGTAFVVDDNRIHGGGTGNICPLVTVKGGQGASITRNYFENGGDWADAFVVIDTADVWSQTATSVTLVSGTTYRYSFSPDVHDFKNGSVVLAAGFTASGYNGSYTVTNPTASTIDLNIGSNPAAIPSVFGTISTTSEEAFWPHDFLVEANYFHGADNTTLPVGKAQWVNVKYGVGGTIVGNFVGGNSSKVTGDSSPGAHDGRPLFRFGPSTRGNFGDFRSIQSSTFGFLTLAQIVADEGTANFGWWPGAAGSPARWGVWPV